MFAIERYAAKRYSVAVRGKETIMEWKDCTVIGVDATSDEPKYVVEMRSEDGTFFVDKVDMVRKLAR